MKYYGLSAYYGWIGTKNELNEDQFPNTCAINCVKNDFKKILYSKKQCSYCKGKITITIPHNIRTCKNSALLGKSSYDSWKEGEMK